MGETAPGMVSITSAPTIVRGVVITGHQVLDGQRANAPSGVVQGFDAITGALRWAWDMEHPERTGLPPEGETYARGTPNMWTTASGDEARGLVYLPLGNAAADYWSSHRSQAENKHSAALVALNVETGREVWRFQTVHMGVWDYDLGSQPTLIDFPTESASFPPSSSPANKATSTSSTGALVFRSTASKSAQRQAAAWSRNCAAQRNPSRAITLCACPIFANATCGACR